MKTATGIAIGVLLSVLTLLVYGTYFARPRVEAATVIAMPDPVVDHTPQYGWVEAAAASQTQVFNPGQAFVSGPLPERSDNGIQKLRVVINAKSPINFAMAPAIWRDDLLNNFVATSQNEIFSCVRQNILQATVECDLPPGPPMIWAMWDTRTPPSGMDTLVRAGFAHLTGVKQPLEEQMLRNDVTTKISAYGCVRNCQ